MSKPILYTKTGCPWCVDVKNYLDHHNISYEEKVVSGQAANMQEMLDLSGQSKAPTMSWDGEILADFGVDELEPFLKQKGVL